MALRNLRLEGDEILRKKSKPVKEINQKIITLLDDMAETMYANEGAGLAAPQVGILKRIVVIDVGDGLVELINPEIVKAEGAHIAFEGCLSIPGEKGAVERPEFMTVKALDRNGQEQIHNIDGYSCVAFSHEIDHLNGILYIDKVIEGWEPEEDGEEYDED